MDDQFKSALEFANYQHTLSIQRKLFKEKAESKLTYGYNGGLFYIDQTLLTFVEMLLTKQRLSGVVLLDKNNNPILIDDVENFRDEIFNRYFEVTYEFYQNHESVKKSRSVEKILEA